MYTAGSTGLCAGKGAVSDTDSQEKGRTEAARALLGRLVRWVHLGDAKLNRKVVAAEGRAACGVNLLLSLGAEGSQDLLCQCHRGLLEYRSAGPTHPPTDLLGATGCLDSNKPLCDVDAG